MIRGVDAIVLIVNDLQKCVDFYQNAFGFPVAYSDAMSVIFGMEDKQSLVILTVPAAANMVGAEALEQHQGIGRRTLLCSGVQNLDETYQALTAKGIAFLKPPKDQAWGRRTAYFADPEGNLWELWQELPA